LLCDGNAPFRTLCPISPFLDSFRFTDHTGVGSEPATIGFGKAAQLLVYWGALGKGNEA
jgi:hypothetical protein